MASDAHTTGPDDAGATMAGGITAGGGEGGRAGEAAHGGPSGVRAGGKPGSGEGGHVGGGGAAHGAGPSGAHGGHASVGFYWMIGGILAVLTAMEVAAFYMELGAVEAPFLLVLSAAKFVLVVMFFMHLRFDSRVFTGLFLAGLVLAAFVVSALFLLYQVLPAYQV